MSNLSQEIMNAIKGRWPNTYPILHIVHREKYSCITALDNSWCIANPTEITDDSYDKLKENMDLFESEYPSLGQSQFPQTVAYFPNICANFQTKIETIDFRWDNAPIRKLSILLGGKEIEIATGINNDFRDRVVARLEAFLAK